MPKYIIGSQQVFLILFSRAKELCHQLRACIKLTNHNARYFAFRHAQRALDGRMTNRAAGTHSGIYGEFWPVPLLFLSCYYYCYYYSFYCFRVLEALFIFVAQNVAGSYIRILIQAIGTCRDYKLPMFVVLMQSKTEIFYKSTVCPSVYT